MSWVKNHQTNPDVFVSKFCSNSVKNPKIIYHSILRSKSLHPIHIENSTVSFEGWIRINFTSMLSEWIVKRRPNNMLYITVEYQNEKGQLEYPSVDANYLLSYWDSDHQPFITAYFQTEDDPESEHGLTLKRNKVKISTNTILSEFDKDVIK